MVDVIDPKKFRQLTPEEEAALPPAERAEVFARTFAVMVQDLSNKKVSIPTFAATLKNVLTDQFTKAEARGAKGAETKTES